MNKLNKIYVTLFFVFTFGLFLNIMGGKYVNSFINSFKKPNAVTTTLTSINWEELYPYDTDIEEISSYVVMNEESITDKLVTKISKFGRIGNTFAKNMYGYAGISKMGYVINSFLSDPSVGYTYARTWDGYWVLVEHSQKLLEDVKDTFASYASLQSYLNSKDIDFLYINAPYKECAVDSRLADSVVSYSNANIDTYIKAMEYYGLNYVDLRDNIHDEELDHYSLFYKSDHHWREETGLWAADEIVSELNAQFGYSLVLPTEMGEYESIVYEDAEFGSLGMGVTHYVADAEDFIVLNPIFPTDYHVEVLDKGIDVTGTFMDVFVDEEGIKKLMEAGGGSAYEKILYGNRPYVKITNNNNPDGIKIVMIRDSYSLVVAPYLAASCSEMILLDTRSDNGNFTGSIINVINEEEPDVVLVLQRSPQPLTLNK